MTLEQLYKTGRKGYIYKINYYLHNYAVAEDLVQDAFVKAFAKISQYNKKKGTIKTWFNSILFSVLWNYKRSLKRQPFQVDILEYLDSEEFAYSEDTSLVTVLESVKNKMHRRVLVLNLVLGYSLAETASLTGEQQGNVRKIVQRYRIGFDSDV
jgi:RNA polymerase sigma factor (sigma-70 family)